MKNIFKNQYIFRKKQKANYVSIKKIITDKTGREGFSMVGGEGLE